MGLPTQTLPSEVLPLPCAVDIKPARVFSPLGTWTSGFLPGWQPFLYPTGLQQLVLSLLLSQLQAFEEHKKQGLAPGSSCLLPCCTLSREEGAQRLTSSLKQGRGHRASQVASQSSCQRCLHLLSYLEYIAFLFVISMLLCQTEQGSWVFGRT